MIRDVVIIFTCPKCNEENRFNVGIPQKDNIVRCPSCGKPIVIGEEFLGELNRIMDGLRDLIERFAKQ
jgi:transcription elongation factor Elf1